LCLEPLSYAAEESAQGDNDAPGSDVKILLLPTNEELKIARETRKLLESKG